METSCQRAVLVAKDEAARRGLPAAVQCDPVQVTEVALLGAIDLATEGAELAPSCGCNLLKARWRLFRLCSSNGQYE